MNRTYKLTVLIIEKIEAEVGRDGVVRPIRTIGEPRPELLIKMAAKEENGEFKTIWELPFTRPLIPI